MDEHKVRDFATKIGVAVEYLHDSGIAIRALDGDGILMSENTRSFSQRVPRISRLSEAKVMGLGDSEFCVGIVGDVRYRAPEVVSGQTYKHKADSWSFGVILFLLLTGKMPFHENMLEEKQQKQQIPASGK